MEYKNKIFFLYAKSNDRLSLGPADLSYFKNRFVGKKLPRNWTAPPVEIYDKSKPMGDFVGWMLKAPVISEKAKKILEPFISKYVQFLYMMEMKDTKLYAMNVIHVIDCLDLNKSDVRYYSHLPDKKVIRRINKYCFDYDKLAFHKNLLIFKIPQTLSEVFVTSDFVDIVQSNNLEGAGFGNPERGLAYLFD
jgi:hypothetical protein